jgi:hypothetical protein
MFRRHKKRRFNFQFLFVQQNKMSGILIDVLGIGINGTIL